MEIKIDSVVVTNWDDFFYRIDPVLRRTRGRTTSKINDRLMAEKEYYSFIEVRDSLCAVAYTNNRQRISIRICYKSLFDDYYEVERKSMAVDGSVINRRVEESTIEPENRFSVY